MFLLGSSRYLWITFGVAVGTLAAGHAGDGVEGQTLHKAFTSRRPGNEAASFSSGHFGGRLWGAGDKLRSTHLNKGLLVDPNSFGGSSGIKKPLLWIKVSEIDRLVDQEVQRDLYYGSRKTTVLAYREL